MIHFGIMAGEMRIVFQSIGFFSRRGVPSYEKGGL